MELFFALFLLAGILGVPLFCLVSGGIALSHRQGGWGRIVVGALWLGLVGLGCLATGGGGAPGALVAVAVIVVALLPVAPLGLLVSGIVAAANRAKPSMEELASVFDGHIEDGSLFLTDGLRRYRALESMAACTVKNVEKESASFYHLNKVNNITHKERNTKTC